MGVSPCLGGRVLLPARLGQTLMTYVILPNVNIQGASHVAIGFEGVGRGADVPAGPFLCTTCAFEIIVCT